MTTGSITSATEESLLPKDISLKQNYPNPFNPLTTIEFTLPSVKQISLKIYDTIGREVREIAGGIYAPGKHLMPRNYRAAFISIH